jgi:hypothetical protein
MPSRLSAPVDDSAQTDRNGLLERAAKTGFVTGYEALRVSASGRRFKIKVGSVGSQGHGARDRSWLQGTVVAWPVPKGAKSAGAFAA